MIGKLEMIAVKTLMRDPNNPRTEFDEEADKQLAASMLKHNIKVPLIGYKVADGIMVSDGHRRLALAPGIGFHELPVIVFPDKPSEADVLLSQLTIAEHRLDLSPVDEFEGYMRLAKLKKWSHSELADNLTLSRSEVTKTMALGKLNAEELQAVREGKLSKSAAYALTVMAPEERAAVGMRLASGDRVQRDKLVAQTRRGHKSEVNNTRRINCPVPGGVISIKVTEELDLKGLISLLEGLLRDCRKLKTQGLNIATAVRVLGDHCESQKSV